jgi:hypothetical protein
MLAHENPQRFFHGGALGGQARCFHSLGEQLVIEFYIGAHGRLYV